MASPFLTEQGSCLACGSSFGVGDAAVWRPKGPSSTSEPPPLYGLKHAVTTRKALAVQEKKKKKKRRKCFKSAAPRHHMTFSTAVSKGISSSVLTPCKLPQLYYVLPCNHHVTYIYTYCYYAIPTGYI